MNKTIVCACSWRYLDASRTPNTVVWRVRYSSRKSEGMGGFRVTSRTDTGRAPIADTKSVPSLPPAVPMDCWPGGGAGRVTRACGPPSLRRALIARPKLWGSSGRRRNSTTFHCVAGTDLDTFTLRFCTMQWLLHNQPPMSHTCVVQPQQNETSA